MNKYRVTERWAAVYADPITMASGQEVSIDHTRREADPEWQGWVWCVAPGGEGWAPEQMLEVYQQGEDRSLARATADYSAQELDAEPGDVVCGNAIINGWLWCAKEHSDHYGWLPLRNLEPVDGRKDRA
ncbi:MAG TPA: SH3 domain-containing protein [Candidatus Edwardsbacteria bacterium]|nr:SH3 domain-containing protein [Candidatus Edwardsbacteria bacterium]